MTPAARLSGAIEVLDRILAGQPAEQALTNWGRAHRFAGSGDRHALRDLVYDALRCKRSHAVLGGVSEGQSVTGRSLVLGGLRAAGLPEAALFSGEGHAPDVVGPAEARCEPEGIAALDCPDWLAGPLRAALGAEFAPVMRALQRRASVFVRVNSARAGLAQAQAMLAGEGMATRPHALASTALEVTENARKIQMSAAYLSGVIELQDAASQAVTEMLPLQDGMRVLDYCAGGGGKTLAMAAASQIRVFAHDGAPRRMQDLPKRALRAGVTVNILKNLENSAPYDLVLTDVPCSGSGSWRRDPQGKWALTAERLAALCTTQAAILDRAAALTARTGVLAYVTCSLLVAENEAQVAAFLARQPGWILQIKRRISPLEGGDGFFVAILTRLG